MVDQQPDGARPPSPLRQTLMVWIAVMPTLTVAQAALGHLLERFPVIMRPPIVATVVVPIVVLVVMPLLHRVRDRLAADGADRRSRRTVAGAEPR